MTWPAQSWSAPSRLPPGGWKVAYEGPLPQREDLDAPGLFPPGGCYLRKLRPHGTACYYWGRLDKEWDLVHRRFGRRLACPFARRPRRPCRSTAGAWTTRRGLRPVARSGAHHHRPPHRSLWCRRGSNFSWSVFNEPETWVLCSGGPTGTSFSAYYDYTTDAVLPTFEDRGHASEKVFIGGLELAGISGVHLETRGSSAPTARHRRPRPRCLAAELLGRHAA